MKKISTFLIITADLLSYCSAALVSLFAYNSDILGLSRSLYSFRVDIFVGGLVIYMFILFNNGSYRRSRDFTGLSRLLSLVKGASVLGLTFIALIFILQLTIPRMLLIFFLLSLPLIGIIMRLVIGKIESTFFNNYFQEKVLVYGAGEKGVSFVTMSERIGQTGLDIIGFVDDRITPQKELGNPKKVLGALANMEGLVTEHNIDRIIVAIRNPDPDVIIKIRNLSLKMNIALSFLPTKQLWEANPIRIRDFACLPMAHSTLEEKPFYDLTKRVLDIGMACAGLLLALPVIILISLILKIRNKGPVIFKHERVGLNGDPFTMYKFRTMDHKSDPYSHSPISSTDKRLTPTGRWLRRTSFDEIPQLLNVLKGNMSMVGPRPEMPFIVDQYEEFMKRRLLVKPGITGLWQISKARTTEIHDNPEYDLHYVENRSIALDFVVLLMTAIFVVRSFTH